MKFRAIQTHTVKGTDGHVVSVKGTEARNGPFEMLKQTRYELIGLSINGLKMNFPFSTWQIVKVKEAIQPEPGAE